MLESTKEIEKKMFIGKLTMNNSLIDETMGERFAREFSKLSFF